MIKRGNKKRNLHQKLKVRVLNGLKYRTVSLKSNFMVYKKAYLPVVIVAGLGMVTGEALAFDLDAAGKGITDPIKAFIDSYWPVGVLGMASGGAVMAQGDMRTRVFGFGAGALMGGIMMTGVKLGLGI